MNNQIEKQNENQESQETIAILPFYLSGWFLVLILLGSTILGITWLNVIIIPILLLIRYKTTKGNALLYRKTKRLKDLYIGYLVLMCIFAWILESSPDPELTIVGDITSTEEITEVSKDQSNKNDAVKISETLELPKFEMTLGELHKKYGIIDTIEVSKIEKNIYEVSYCYLSLTDMYDDSFITICVNIENDKILDISGAIMVKDSFAGSDKMITVSNTESLEIGLNYAIPFINMDTYDLGDFGVTGSMLAIRIMTAESSIPNTLYAAVELVNYSDELMTVDLMSFDTINNRGDIYPAELSADPETALTALLISPNTRQVATMVLKGNRAESLNLRYQYAEGEYTQFVIAPVEK